jgi:hypothetical protein
MRVIVIVPNNAEKRSILNALKVQLKRITEDKESHKDMPLILLLRLNEEISRLSDLIKTLSKEER